MEAVPQNLTEWEEQCTAVLQDPTTHSWVRDALRVAQEKDPLDAAYGAEVIANLLKQRVDLILGQDVSEQQETKGHGSVRS